tara:strand:+ start:4277 stop:4837 length:561 start_codon:yes stop_codon:yes gene_type:complete
MVIDFEKIHKAFDGTMLDLCTECGGQCEKNEISVFLPGEVEFIANKINFDKQKFVDDFCNIIKFKNHDIHMLKAGVCPFLNKEYRCELEDNNCKLIHCLMYPILIGIEDNKIKIFVDTKHCPMAHKIQDDFKNHAFNIYESIKNDIPKWWLEFVSKYDECTYDYPKLEKIKDNKIISINELEDCIT